MVSESGAVLLHDVLGTTVSAHFLSWVYLIFLPFVPVSVTAWLAAASSGLTSSKAGSGPLASSRAISSSGRLTAAFRARGQRPTRDRAITSFMISLVPP